MRIEKSVMKSIDEWQAHDFESSMLHACNAVDGTARKHFPGLCNKKRFTQFLRDNHSILGPMGAPGIDLAATRFPIRVDRPTASGGLPDLADVIYAIHRCTHAHGDELPDGFELIADAAGEPRVTRMEIEHGKLRLSDRIIFGLIATVVFSPINAQLTASPSYFLTFGAREKMVINDWWGRAADFAAVVSTDPMPQVKLDFGEWHP
jgi:hypothetical protein